MNAEHFQSSFGKRKQRKDERQPALGPEFSMDLRAECATGPLSPMFNHCGCRNDDAFCLPTSSGHGGLRRSVNRDSLPSRILRKSPPKGAGSASYAPRMHIH